MGVLLEVDGISRRFGALVALDDVSAQIAAGEIRGLIGPNGAGKTTLINVISGFLPPTAGRVSLDGQRVDRRPAHARVRIGLGRTFQTPQLCARMPVLDNIVVGGHQRFLCARAANVRGWRSRARLRDLRVEATAIAQEVGLAECLAVRAGSLSYGHMRLLEVARALMSRPRLLLLDEPVAGLNDAESAEVAALVRRLAGEGMAILVVEHDMSFVMSLCTRLTVLDHGVLLAEGTPAEIQHDPRVESVYLGTAQRR